MRTSSHKIGIYLKAREDKLVEISQAVHEVPEMSPDRRVRVFRRSLGELDDFEGMEVDAYVVLGERYVIVLDTLLCPSDMAAVMAAIEPEIGHKQLLCVNSHADWDHTWGNCYFSDERALPILAHEHCLRRMLTGEARQELEDYQKRYPLFQNVKLLPPTLTFSERLTLLDGALTIELLHSPGHCQDQVVAWLPEMSLLLAFDAIERPLPCIEESACAPLMFSTLQRLAALNAQYVLCSHGKTTSPALIEENLAYLGEIKRRAHLLLAKYILTEAEIEQATELIDYPLESALASPIAEGDHAFYAQAHEQNVHAILRWLLGPDNRGYLP